MVDDLFHCAPIADGKFDYLEFTRTLKHGAREKDDGDTMKDLVQGQIPTLAQEQPGGEPDVQAESEACG